MELYGFPCNVSLLFIIGRPDLALKCFIVQGSGHELYGYPGYGSLLLGASGLEQNMPPSAIAPNNTAAAGGAMAAGLMFNGGTPYHPGYTPHSIQV
jgi:hypothetical protein